MRNVQEIDFQPLWPQHGTRPHPPNPDLRAVEAFIDAHIARPDLDMGRKEFEFVVLYAGCGYRSPLPGMARLEAIVEQIKFRRMRKGARKKSLVQVMDEAALTDRQREALEAAQRLTKNGNPDLGAIARDMGVKRATARVHLERAREKMAQYLQRRA